ncbi:MAG: deoxyguanosinetriphosphate triphosphohydrolase [Alphaproteobacteria bacterium]|nr:deoxyguanosinetriphosphate triphosphohydrolase [Alphaproteobacteria bacterium]
MCGIPEAKVLASHPAGRLIGPLFEPPKAIAPYATRPADSRGRLYPEPESPTRTCYQRDRDRIIHSTAFRRLKHKTQVFVEYEGDYYRTRLTHSLEVAQIARSLARVLALDEDLAEAIALSHDLGHTPFGHAGEEALNEAARAFGGFDHNAHALKLVTQLEHRYADFDGLNLTWETLEGLVKHNGPLPQTPLLEPIASFDAHWSLELSTWPGLEAQVAALADDIAYVNHDIDDGLRAGLFTVDELCQAPLVGGHVRQVNARCGTLELGRLIGETVRALMSMLIRHLIDETCRRIAAAAPTSAASVRKHAEALAGLDRLVEVQLQDLKLFLFQRMYRNPRVMKPVDKAKLVVRELFEILSANPLLMPRDWAARCGEAGDAMTAAVVRDYIAGMTDRFALAEYARFTHTQIAL